MSGAQCFEKLHSVLARPPCPRFSREISLPPPVGVEEREGEEGGEQKEKRVAAKDTYTGIDT